MDRSSSEVNVSGLIVVKSDVLARHTVVKSVVGVLLSLVESLLLLLLLDDAVGCVSLKCD